MATLVLSAVGAAVGGSVGGSVLGLSSVVIGRAVGAAIGSSIDQRMIGAGSETVEVGRRDQLRVMASREGAPIPRVWGRMRMSGQVIWASRFAEHVTRQGGGKGAPSAPKTKSYTYSISLAVAICEGEVARINRIWADGEPMDLGALNWRFYRGTEDQLPDSAIAASLPDGEAPAYRGTAYVFFEDLDVSPFGNRVPQFNFEVVRKGTDTDAFDLIRGVALTPGTGEYALATDPVRIDVDKGVSRLPNVNGQTGLTDAEASVEALHDLAPNCEAASLVVSWFGDDLRCGSCSLKPKVEQSTRDASTMPWKVAGVSRSAAEIVEQVEGRPGFGGTPADTSVIQSIRLLRDKGKGVMFYPFILMDIRAGNGLQDPWSGAADQPEVPWRGRITLSKAPGRAGSPDKTAAAAAEVAAFFGTAEVADFALNGGKVVYTGPHEWSYRRFILHYAHLAKAAGGVSSFCIGSELRSLTQIRSAGAVFPAVTELRRLAADVRAVLGPDVKIGYAADWSEYFGYHPTDGSGDVLYHLDELWADPAIDFVGIDNYMPLSDWRGEEGHADAHWGSIYDLDYLKSNIEGGEGYDWYYPGPDARAAQLRVPITDGAYNDPWVFRNKDIRNWWSRPHWNRIGGIRTMAPTAWEPEMKPIWFTEIGCPAVDKGTNQPNVFTDPQSSENALPYHSNGGQDVYLQHRYLRALLEYWGEAGNNPTSRVYDGPMIDTSRTHVWAWDLRPWPEFPTLREVWSDGPNHALGHWISGRAHLVPLADVVRDICGRSGLTDVDVGDLHGMVRGYMVGDTETARQSLQPLMLAYGIDVFERDGKLVFRNRGAEPLHSYDLAEVALEEADAVRYELIREPESEFAERVRIGFLDGERDFQAGAAEARLPGSDRVHASGTDLPLVLTQDEADAAAARWLAESLAARDRIRFSVPRSRLGIGAGGAVDVILDGRSARFRIDRVEETLTRNLEGVRIEPELYRPRPSIPLVITRVAETKSAAPYVEFMDLPLLTGNEVPDAPHVAGTMTPWPGGLAVVSAPGDHGYVLNTVIERNAIMGATLEALPAGQPGVWQRRSVAIRISSGELEAREVADVLNGANAAALRSGAGDWEVFQFRRAELVAEGIYRLSGLLRGQAGTDAVVPPVWPVGTDFVLLDGAPVQLDLPQSALGLERFYRIGPADKPMSDQSYVALRETARGVGLRPYAPAHLRARRRAGGDIDVKWIRRTRIGGDRWDLPDVPLGEAFERYRVQVLSGATVLREVDVAQNSFVYSVVQQAADGAAQVAFSVSQISDVFGPGPSTRMDFHG